MIEQLPLLLATPIAKAVLDKFYEGVGSKLGEKAVELLPEKVKQLGQLVWEKCLRGKQGTEEALQKAANGSAADQEKLAVCLHKMLEKDDILRQEAQKIAEEIHLEVTQHNIQAKNVMNVSGQAQGLQVNDPNQPVIQVQGNPVFNFGASPKAD
jgi:hypothetical protein